MECKAVLSSDSDLEVDFEGFNVEEKDCDQLQARFLDQVNRGGLKKPSDLVFLACLWI